MAARRPSKREKRTTKRAGLLHVHPPGRRVSRAATPSPSSLSMDAYAVHMHMNYTHNIYCKL